MTAPQHIFVDAQLSPAIAQWIGREFGVRTTHVLALDLPERTDKLVLRAAQVEGGAILSKDEDFPKLMKHRHPPPSVIWLRCGNLPDRLMKQLLREQLSRAISLLRMGETVVEIDDPWKLRRTRKK